jgi:hypothetical protein
MGGDDPEQRESFDRVAAQQRADLTREQWSDYQKRYAPWEDKLIDFIDDPEVEQKAIGRAKEGVESSYTSGLGQMQRNRSRLGESSTLNASEHRSLALGKTAAMVQAQNDAVAYTADRREKVRTSGLSSAGAMSRGKG